MLKLNDAIPRSGTRTPGCHELFECPELHLLLAEGTRGFIPRLQACGSRNYMPVVEQQTRWLRGLIHILRRVPFGRREEGPPFGGPIVVIHSATPYCAGLASGKQDHHLRPIEEGSFPTEATRPAKAQ